MPCYNYHKIIEQALVRNNYAVKSECIYEYDLTYNLLLRVPLGMIKRYQDFKFRRFIKKISIYNFDYLFFVQPFNIKDYYVLNLRKLFPNAKFILYNWDPIRVFNYIPILELFDSVFSYDPFDCLSHEGIKYLPLFYSGNKTSTISKDIDLSTVCTYNDQRRELIHFFITIVKKNHLAFYYYMHMNFRTWTKNMIHGNIIRNIHFLPLNYYKVKRISERSKAVIDMPGLYNPGLTMRTFETLGFQTKLITTNKSILDTDFYNPNNIFVIQDYKNIKHEEILEFLRKPFVFEEDFKKYHINSWVKEIFKQYK